jgi:hypothetical protein
MPTKRLLMRRIRDVLRLKLTKGMSDRAIATSLGLSKGSVNNYVSRARRAGLDWPLPDPRSGLERSRIFGPRRADQRGPHASDHVPRPLSGPDPSHPHGF